MIHFDDLLNLQGLLFLYMGLGVAVSKLGILTPDGRKSLTDLIIDVVLPCNIISSFYVEMSSEVLLSAGAVLVLAFGIQILQLFLSKILYPHIKGKRKSVLEYGTICSNAGYLGNPVVEGIYGADGLLYASIYLIPARIFMWSAGLTCFTPVTKKDILRKLFTHPCIIAVEIGLVLLISQVRLPGLMESAIKNVGGCTTVLSMVTIGAVIGESDMSHVISRDTLYYCFIRLILIPGLVMGIGRLLRLEAMVLGICVVLAGMPAGATTTLLAAKYGGDAGFASRFTALSTLLSMVTIPLLCLFL